MRRGISLATEISPSRTLGAPALAGNAGAFTTSSSMTSAQSTWAEAMLSNHERLAKNPINTFTINHVTAFPDPTSHVMLLGNFLEDDPMFGSSSRTSCDDGQHPFGTT